MRPPFTATVEPLDPLTHAVIFRFSGFEFQLVVGRDEKVLNRMAAELNAGISNALSDYLKIKGVA